MTLLSMCQDVAIDVGVTMPLSIIGNTDISVSKLLAAAQTEGSNLASGIIAGELGRHNWSDLMNEFTFNTANGVDSYLITTYVGSDFARFINDTFWNRTQRRKMELYNPQEWQLVNSGIVAPVGINQKYRIMRKKFFIFPTPTVVDVIAGDYVSKNFCQSAIGVGQSRWLADDDVGILDEDLMRLGIRWRYLRNLGEAYFDELEEYNGQVKAAMAADGVRTNTPKPPVFFGFNIPETGIGI